MSRLSICQLGDLIEFQRGYDLPKSKFVAGPYPVQSSNGILGYHNEYKVEAPGITIGRSGTVGLPHMLEENFYPHNTALYIKDFKGNDVRYIYYLLKYLKLGDKKSGSGVPTMNRNHLHPLAINAFRNITDQKSISSVLHLVDQKIELNNRINAELEAMAKTLYDYWFVQFDFPDANGKPYKASGGKMVYDPTLKRDVPDEWEVTTVGKIAKTELGGTPSTAVDEYWNDADIPWLSSAETASFPVTTSEQKITQAGIDNSAATLLPKGTVIISIVRYIRPSILGIDSATNQSVVGIRECKRLKSSFIYPYFCSEVPRLMGLRTGAQQPHINKGVIEKSPIVIPSDKALTDYYKVADPIFEKIMNLAFQNQELMQLRDWLLPMLMNGQVTVNQSTEPKSA
ncbi:restriction endonuclease subunit S [Vibrio parahaemolyticus]|uniref:restriction endonuclease subunit S n=1 Tax=Vibrio TaxID=662 RepID=UPI000812D6D6|nr:MULTISPECIES: restriction endonuclease subunit S [Vibrio]EGQ8248341.1 restriction endonuclease subunit S [Vibrio parahaemolyticus]EGQ8930108.1 restriction endonuclease subunit S [Vibrio parahaemolyticus]EGQ8974580.1 restriction endonuclease subunit S [Vibrio parahaemolyticus]EGQ8979030.1 restriction endonuclease subunit S [Vibrio parahaemolyticus]EGQ8998583.1 restriction endonuclease subunit S [Vibrio parahaemolyticus]